MKAKRPGRPGGKLSSTQPRVAKAATIHAFSIVLRQNNPQNPPGMKHNPFSPALATQAWIPLLPNKSCELRYSWVIRIQLLVTGLVCTPAAVRGGCRAKITSETPVATEPPRSGRRSTSSQHQHRCHQRAGLARPRKTLCWGISTRGALVLEEVCSFVPLKAEALWGAWPAGPGRAEATRATMCSALRLAAAGLCSHSPSRGGFSPK